MSAARLFAAPAIATLLLLAFAGPAGAIDFPSLAAALRAGGFVLHVRPAPPPDIGTVPDRRESCGDHGWPDPAARLRLRTVGAAIASLEIPVGEVLTGADCASLRAARTSFPAPALFGGAVAADPAALVPAAGSNLVVVTPGALDGGPDPAPGMTTVYRRADDGRLEAVVALDAVDWARLVTGARAE